jgi:hypothetical protein
MDENTAVELEMLDINTISFEPDSHSRDDTTESINKGTGILEIRSNDGNENGSKNFDEKTDSNSSINELFSENTTEDKEIEPSNHCMDDDCTKNCIIDDPNNPAVEFIRPSQAVGLKSGTAVNVMGQIMRYTVIEKENCVYAILSDIPELYTGKLPRFIHIYAPLHWIEKYPINAIIKVKATIEYEQEGGRLARKYVTQPVLIAEESEIVVYSDFEFHS